MLNPLFTVVIPAFGRADALRRAVASVLSQTIASLEIVVVDDHSPQPLEPLLLVSDSRLRFVRLDSNRGGAAARNAGVSAARGKYVAFLDSDDEWVPNKLEAVLPALERAIDRSVVYHALRELNGAQAAVRPTRGIDPNEEMDEYLFVHDELIQTSTIVGQRAIFTDIPFDESLRRHQDWDLCLRLAQRQVKFIFVPETLTIWHHAYAQGRVSMSTSLEPSLQWLSRAKLSRSARAALELSILFDRHLVERNFTPCLRLLYNNFASAPRKTLRKALVLSVRALRK